MSGFYMDEDDDLSDICAVCGKTVGRHGYTNGECPAEDDLGFPPHRWHHTNKFVRSQGAEMKKPVILSVLQEADKAVSVDRMKTYGDPKVNFSRWRDMCQATNRPSLKDITAEDLAVIMILGKLSRDVNAPQHDNCVDIAGFASILNDVRGL
jgi:hypothetical protein